MRQVLLSPRWLVRHAVAVALVVAFLLLGWWQLREAAAGGTARNVAYALEWPLFASFVVFLWWRTLRAELRGRAEVDSPGPAPAPRDDAGPATAGRTVPVRRWSRPDSPPVTEPDQALVDYNRYLAQLDAQLDAQHRHPSATADRQTTEENPT